MRTKKHKRARTSKEMVIRFMSIGESTYLDADIVRGLFKACNGNRYVVVHNSGHKFAVAVRHSFLPQFSIRRLSNKRLEYGTWWGRPLLRLTHAAVRDPSADDAGIISLRDEYAYLRCHSEEGRLDWVPIGWVGPKADGYCFDAWALDAPDLYFPFVERQRNGDICLGELELDVPPNDPNVLDVEFDYDEQAE